MIRALPSSLTGGFRWAPSSLRGGWSAGIACGLSATNEEGAQQTSCEQPANFVTLELSSDDDDSLLDLFASDDAFGVNSIGVHISGVPSTDEVLADDALVDDPVLDVDDSEFAQLPQCCCSSPTSPIDQFLLDASVASPCSVGDVQVLQHVFNTDGVPHEHAVNAVRQHDYHGPRTHLDNRAQATTAARKKSHFFACRTFPVDAPCQTHFCRWSPLCPCWFWHSSCPSTELSWMHPGVLPPRAGNSILCHLPVHDRTSSRQEATPSWTAGTFAFTVHSALHALSENVIVHGILDARLCHTQPLLLPQQPDCDDPVPTPSTASSNVRISPLTSAFDSPSATIESKFHLHRLSAQADCLLWHQQLAHCSNDHLCHAHNHTELVCLSSSTKTRFSITVPPALRPR